MNFEKFWTMYEAKHGPQPVTLKDFSAVIFRLGSVTATHPHERSASDSTFAKTARYGGPGAWINVEPPKVLS